MITTYHQTQTYLNNKIPTGQTEKFPGHLGLERMREFLRRLDNPQLKYETIHVVGTAGKGSTSYLTAKILQQAGLKVGLHTSPHLTTLRERFVVNGQMISEAAFVEVIAELEPVIEGMASYQYGKPSYFEVLVAACFVWFAKSGIDVAVIEAGLGGKFDGTNVLEATVCIVTNVGLDHTQILGNTKTKILQDKMQVIKQGNAVAITGVTQPKLLKLLRAHCAGSLVPLLVAGQDFKATDVVAEATHSQFSYQSGQMQLKDIIIKTPGLYQVTNASLAITACLEYAKVHEVAVTDEVIKTALSQTAFAGRFEVVRENPLLVLDGAHNPDKIKALVAAWQAAYPGQQAVVVFGLKKNKNAGEMLKLLQPIVAAMVVTQFSQATDMGLHLHYPAEELGIVAEEVLDVPVEVEVASEVALTQAEELGGEMGVGVLVTGSLYLVGEVKQ